MANRWPPLERLHVCLHDEEIVDYLKAVPARRKSQALEELLLLGLEIKKQKENRATSVSKRVKRTKNTLEAEKSASHGIGTPSGMKDGAQWDENSLSGMKGPVQWSENSPSGMKEPVQWDENSLSGMNESAVQAEPTSDSLAPVAHSHAAWDSELFVHTDDLPAPAAAPRKKAVVIRRPTSPSSKSSQSTPAKNDVTDFLRSFD